MEGFKNNQKCAVITAIIVACCFVAYTDGKRLTLSVSSLGRVHFKDHVLMECTVDKLQPGERIRWVKQLASFTFTLATGVDLQNTFIQTGRYSMSTRGSQTLHLIRLSIQDARLEDTGTYGCMIEGSDIAEYKSLAVCDDADGASCTCIQDKGWVTPECFTEPLTAADVHAKYNRIVIGLVVCLVIAILFGLMMTVMVARDCLSKTAAIQKKKLEDVRERSRQQGPEERRTLQEASDTGIEDPSILETYNALQAQYHNGIVNSGFHEENENDYEKTGAAAAAAAAVDEHHAQPYPEERQRGRQNMHMPSRDQTDAVVHHHHHHRPHHRSADIPESGRATPEGSLNLSDRGHEPAVLNVTHLPGYSQDRNPMMSDHPPRGSPNLHHKAVHNNNGFGSTKSLDMDHHNRSKDYTPSRSGDLSPMDVQVESRQAYTDARPKANGHAGRTAFAEPRKLDFHVKRDPKYSNRDNLGGAYVDRTDTMI